MKLRRIELANVRLFRQPLVIDDLRQGINLFSGPNGSGKSSVVAAIRAAFLERHRSAEGAQHLRSQHDPAAAVRVRIDFEVGGIHYELAKEFPPRRRCLLRAGAETLDGEAAEQRLGALLGYGYAAKGAARPQSMGVPGLLWIDQGTGHEIDEPVSHASSQLAQAIADSAGAMASTDGDAVVVALRRQLDALVTSKLQKPTGEHARLVSELAALDAEIASLGGRITEHAALADQLAQWQAELVGLQRDAPWLALEASADRTQAELEAGRALEKQLADARHELGRTGQIVSLVRGKIEQLRAPMLDLPQLHAQVLAQAERTAALTQAEARHAAALQAAEAQERQATQALEHARAHARRVEVQTRIAHLGERIESLQVAIRQVQGASDQRAAVAPVLAGGEPQARVLAELRRLQQEHREVSLRIEAAATRLTYAVQAGVTLTIDGEPLAGNGNRLIESATRIEAEGMQLLLTPGGADLDALRVERERQATELAAALGRAGVADIAEFESRRERWLQARQQDQLATATLQASAPAGMAALEQSLSDAGAALANAESEGAALSAEAHDDDSGDTHHLVLSEAEATRRLQAAAAATRETRQQHTEALQQLAGAREASTQLERTEAQTRSKAESPQLRQEIEIQQAALLEHEQGSRLLSSRIETLSEQVRAADLARLEAHARQLREDAQRARGHLDALGLQVASVRGQVQALGAGGMDEEHARLQLQRESLQLRLRERQRQVEVLNFLLQRIESHREATRRNLVLPLQQRVDHYLQLLMPDARLRMGEALAPAQLVSAADQHDRGGFGQQSFGTREQIGVICRLAYADLLKAAGRPTLLILDDALVHSDEDRLGAMKRVLLDAAERHQMLVFTCHPGRWEGVGAAPRPMSELIAA